MAKSYKITELGAADLKEIWEYIAELNYGAANRTINKISQKFDLLAQNPQLGKSQDDYIINLRSFPYKNMSLFIFRSKTAWKFTAFFTARGTSKIYLKPILKD